MLLNVRFNDSKILIQKEFFIAEIKNNLKTDYVSFSCLAECNKHHKLVSHATQ